MSTNGGLFWLSSYPKSGNTWFRVFLANLLNTSSEPITLNQIHTGAIASSRQFVDEALGFDSACLEHDEIDQLRPAAYTWLSLQKSHVGYHKIHDAYTFVDNQTPLIPAEGCLGALYFIRNPLDVAISFANHSHCSIDQAIKNMGDTKFAFCKSRGMQHNQLRQRLLSWSLHVDSWMSKPAFDVLGIRYEDMKREPLATFTKAVRFLKLTATDADIARALDNAHIDKLQEEEAQFGFHEKPMRVARFFRKGVVGDWQSTLTEEQINQVIQDHSKMMQTYGYLDANLNPIRL